ncbi:hypothetical protein OC846_001918 [Tilletia horrida]|uniref:Uncharacterized protein n=1 Tax=Tilletia horrida TaxID=155126 RepID=A0AAN6GTA7_9BASI|nr:hypothetical protein OC845_006832 [Tilletia horrida]KAK0554967.1 hypothetical protein OC846_001918 [Tilletia horrida]
MASFSSLFGSSSSSVEASAPAPADADADITAAAAATTSQQSNTGWLSSISSYIGSSIAAVASPNSSSYNNNDDDDDHDADDDDDHHLVLPKNEELADIAEDDEDDHNPPHYQTDDKGRKLLIPTPAARTTDPLETNQGPTETIGAPQAPSSPTDPAAAAQGYSNPTIFPDGSSFTSSNEPLNIIISANSSPDVLTRKGLQSYLRSINFDFECLNLHSGGPQYATIDATGKQAQIFEYRDVLTPVDHIFGTCIESLLGGNHVRGYQQQLTNAWFLAVSTEENVTQAHTIKPDGYNLGRDDFVQRSQSQPNAQTDFFFQAWRTSVTWVTGLIPMGTTANHDITVDGKTAVLTITSVSLFSAGQAAPSTTGTTAPVHVAATPSTPAQPATNGDASTTAPVAPVAVVAGTAAGAVAPSPMPAPPSPAPAVAPTAAGSEEAPVPASRKSTDKPSRPAGKRFSFGLKRRLSAQISKADADKVLADVEAHEQQQQGKAVAAAVGEISPASTSSSAAPLPTQASLAAEEATAASPSPATPAAADGQGGTTTAAAAAVPPLEVPKLKRRESGLKKFIGRVQQGRKSSAGQQRSVSGSSSPATPATPAAAD